jgi:anti-anti-sigma factor
MDIPHRLGGQDGEVLIVSVPGELTHDSADDLRQTVARRLPNRDGAGAVIDLTGVQLITSIGIAALLQVQEFCRDRDARVLLAGLSDRLRGFLRMLKLDRKFELADSVDDAIAALAAGM